MIKHLITLCFVALFLAACSSNETQKSDDNYDQDTANGRYKYSQDHAPTEIPPLDNVEDAVPRYEPYSRGGNKDYTVRGVDYEVWRDITKLTERGGASWYGNKFHGHLTSNGERYNMFAMSAAHKNLPLPSYVQVTNLENNKQIIVRVNDRGPFHEGRIIDLSYAAANKLDIIKAGTGQVEIKLLHFPEETDTSALYEEQSEAVNGNYSIQYLVTSSAEKAESLTQKATHKYHAMTYFEQKGDLYYLRVGPLSSQTKANRLLSEIREEFGKAYIIHTK